jgi:hypothetical protein
MSETQFYLSIQGRNIPLNYYTNLTQADIHQLHPQGDDDVVARINPNPKNRAILGLKNCSNQMWTATLPTGEIRQIQIGQTVKLEENTQLDFGLIYGRITRNNFNYSSYLNNHQDVICQTISDEDKKDRDNSNNKKITPRALITVSIIALVLASPIFVYSLFFNKTSQYEPENPPPEETTNTCNGLVSRRNELGISNWDEVNQRFWQQTDYPYGQALDSNHPNYNYYQEQWCKIANEWLSEKESNNNSSSNDTPTPESTSLSESTITELSESEALELIRTWLGAKSKIFNHPYDKSLMSEILTNKAFNKVENAVNQLEQNQQYYNFEEQQIESVDNFFQSNSNKQVIIDVVLNESYKLYNKQGKIDTKEKNYYRGVMRFHLIYSDENKWKIYDYENIKNL